MKVLIYPRARDNPYHDFLYGEMRKTYSQDIFTYLESRPTTVIFFPLKMLVKRLQGYRIFHLHWLAFYLAPKYHIPFAKQISFINTLWSITVLRLLGYKIIWTVHDLLPHDEQTPNDIYIARKLAKRARAKIIPSSSTVYEMKRLGIDTNNIHIVPLGNYENIYEVSVSKTDSRKKLHIDSSSFVFSSFGRVEPYKGLETLIIAFKQLVTSCPNRKLTLIIAGRCDKDALKKNLNELAQDFEDNNFSNGELLLHLEYVNDRDVHLYHQSSDLEVYPFTEITNSSSVLLSFAFGKAVIAPKIGAIRDLPKKTGVFYESSNSEALLKSMEWAINLDDSELKKMSLEASKYSSSLSWSKIAKQTYQVYQEAFSDDTKKKS